MTNNETLPKEEAYGIVRAELARQGFDIGEVYRHNGREKIKILAPHNKNQVGTLTMPHLQGLSREIAVQLLNARVLEAANEAINEPGFRQGR